MSHAQPSEVNPAPTAEIETFEQLWNAGQLPGNSECRVHARLFVLCYFADWKALWVQWGKEVHYLDGGSKPLPLQAGRWYDVRGLARAASQTFLWDKTQITPLTDLSTPQPVMLDDHTSNLDSIETQFAEVTGVVDEQVELDNGHFRLNVVFGPANVSVFVGAQRGEPIPQLSGAIVRVKGVLSVKRDMADVLPKLELWCQSRASIDVRGFLAQDPRFSIPATAIETIVVRPQPERVRVQGTVYRQEPGRALVLRDRTGQIKVLTSQVQPAPEGEAVEAIGYPARDGLALVLRDGLFRPTTSGTQVQDIHLILRLADQVRTLGPEDVARHTEAKIGGVVTWSSPANRFFFIEDETGGVKVLWPSNHATPLPVVGTGVTVLGTVVAGDFAPAIEATAILPGDNLAEPQPSPISWEEAMTGANYGGWVEMQGYVRSASRQSGEFQVELTTSGGAFTAVLPNYEGPDLVGANVRVRGVCDAIANERRQLKAFRVLVPGSEYLQVLEPAPADPFATRVDSIGSLMRYNPRTTLNRRVQVEGTVLLHVPGRLLYVQDGSDTLTVLSRQSVAVQPGDRVAIVGIPGQEGGRLLMRDAIYRRTGSGAPPTPLVLSSIAPDAALDGRLVRVRGVLLSREPVPRGVRLQLQQATNIFSARLESGPVGELPSAIGSVLELTGVYRVELDEYRRPRGVVINLRSLRDVTIVERPAWWTAQRVLWVGGVLLAGAIVALAWGLMLSRKNEQLERARGELQRANEELEGRVAERTHDLRLEVDQRRASEQALAQERMLLRTLIDNLPVYLYVKDSTGRFIIDNVPHAKLLGARSCADVIGKTEADFWPPDLADDRRQSDDLVINSGEPLLLHEEPFVTGTERRWHSTTKVPLRDAAGRVTGLIAIVQDISARKEVEADRENLHRQLLETSRQAGMAEVATGVLHNIGNVLNSVNISAAVAAETIARSKTDRLKVLTRLITDHRQDLAGFFARDPRAQRIPEYVEAISEQLREEHEHVLAELRSLQQNIDHIKQVVAMQQTYAKIAGVTEKVPVQEIVEDALRINGEGLARHRVRAVRDLRVNPMLVIERHKVLQILVNLISNAKYACDDSGREDKLVSISVDQHGDVVAITVADNGVGIKPENLTRIFSHGFTTRKNGHGFGLHSGAITARELGGALKVASDGHGCGAAFTLEIPLVPRAVPDRSVAA